MIEPTDGRVQRRVHKDSSGVAVLSYLPYTEPGLSVARDVEVLLFPEAVEAVLNDLSGFIVSGPAEFGEALTAQGAVVRRRFWRMIRPLAGDPPPDSWAAADLGEGRWEVAVDRDPREVLPAWWAAYDSESNPDRMTMGQEAALTEQLAPTLTGARGAVLPWSRLVVEVAPDGRDRVIAGVVVIEFDTELLIADVFRHPDPGYAGLGTALLRRVLAAGASAGAGQVGLSVSESNSARRVYERLGFVTVKRSLTVVIP
jgi:GNAT superfamily N-acetyltransferase